jgi:hypothetical protein
MLGTPMYLDFARNQVGTISREAKKVLKYCSVAVNGSTTTLIVAPQRLHAGS